MNTSGLDVDKIKANVMDYWKSEGWNWPVKVISRERAQALNATLGRIIAVSGYITAEKFVRGRSTDQLEKMLGLIPGELKNGAVILRLNALPQANQFDLRGYTQTPAGEVYAGGIYPPGLGASQWQLTAKIPATVLQEVSSGKRA